MNGRGPKPTTAGQDSAADWQRPGRGGGGPGRIGDPRCPLTGVLRVGTRGSALALAQSGTVADRLAAVACGSAELVDIRTQGDVNLGPLASIGGTGVFVIEVRSRLLAGDVDVVVHSLKDLPTAPAAASRSAAVPGREDPADALCARERPHPGHSARGAVVGTGSPRRMAQLLRHRPDLVVKAIRGNVDTRLAMVGDGSLDAVVLAVAGLARLGRCGEMTHRLAADLMLPAPAQGALAVETRTTDAESSWFADALREIDDARHPIRRDRRTQPARRTRGRLHRPGRRLRHGRG